MFNHKLPTFFLVAFFSFFTFCAQLLANIYPNNPTNPTNSVNPTNPANPANPLATPSNIIGNRPDNAVVSIFVTDFESTEGYNAWTSNPFGNDNAASIGRFQVGTPQKTKYQLASTPDGKQCLLTGLTNGGNPSANDLDDGLSSIASPMILLPEVTGTTRLEFSCKWLFAHAANIEKCDFFRVKILCENKELTMLEIIGDAQECAPNWTDFNMILDQFAGKNIRILVEASDNGQPSLLEAGLDAVAIKAVTPALWIETFASPAWDDNRNAVGGRALHSVVVEANWTNLLPNDSLRITIPGAIPESQIFVPTSANDMVRLVFKVPMDSTNAHLNAQFLVQKGLKLGEKLNLPKKGGLLTPCLATDFGGKIWLDSNYDGALDSTEMRGIESVPVWAQWFNPETCETGSVSTKTDYLGQYAFHFGKNSNEFPVAEGLQIRLSCESLELSTRRGKQNIGTDLRFLVAKQGGCAENFGLAQPAKTEQKAGEIGNLIWEDTNGDGVQNIDENGLEGVQISLYDDLGNFIALTNSDKMGNYFFNETNVQETIGDVEKVKFAGPVPGKTYLLVIGKSNDSFKPLENKLIVGQKQLEPTEFISRKGFDNAPDNSDGQLFKGFLSVKSLVNGFPGTTLVAPAAGGAYRYDFGFRPISVKK